jgi:hypothetical protein
MAVAMLPYVKTESYLLAVKADLEVPICENLEPVLATMNFKEFQ